MSGTLSLPCAVARAEWGVILPNAKPLRRPMVEAPVSRSPIKSERGWLRAITSSILLTANAHSRGNARRESQCVDGV